ncbi:hypothetical protein [Pseudidiomarina mangrovi]|uniref:hypothetical protein n=1 Tax=Pseudidiomarina mangrovi TaxID=2487133 RepID=UPI000FCC383A|nr:hypothetical protein [Pseudidiomarina mangrovi]
MQQYQFSVPNLAAVVAYFQQQLGLPLLQQQQYCAEFALSDDTSIQVRAAQAAAAPACLPMTERLLSALQSYPQHFSRPFLVAARHCCELPVKLRVPQQRDVTLCQQPRNEQAVKPVSRSTFWAQLRTVYADLARFDGYRF